jgi:hypothetical protein
MSNRTSQDQQPTAFVLMPFDAELKPVFDELLVPPLKAAGFRVERADSSLDQQNILKRIVRAISGSHVVVAVLTKRNANVFYELGLAHGLNKATILVAGSIEDIPFDLRSYRVNVYSVGSEQAKAFKKWLRELGRRLLTGEIRFDNPVSDFLPLTAQPTAGEVPAAETEREPAEAAAAEEGNAEPGFLDWWADADEGAKEATASLRKMNAAMKDMAKGLAARAEQMKQPRVRAQPGTAARLRMIAAAAARDILDFVAVTERELPTYRASWERFADSTASLLRSPLARERQQRQSVSELRVAIAQALQNTDGAIAALDRLRQSTGRLRTISRDLNFAADRVVGTIGQIRVELETSKASCVKMLGLLDEILEEGRA